MLLHSSGLRRFLVGSVSSLALAFWAHTAAANPMDGVVEAGSAEISAPNPGNLVINQMSDKAIINWGSFNVGLGEHTQFVLPGRTSVTLNRDFSGDPSEILGSVTSNGRFYLVNPNGILFGQNARVDVAGLVATTHDIRSSDFLDDRLDFSIAGEPGASVINQGQIRVDDLGFGAFVAPHVRNDGAIVAYMGKVELASASGFTLDLRGDSLISFLVENPNQYGILDANGQPVSALVENSGTITADGGQVVLRAAAARGVVDSVINTDGIIQANTVEQRGGKIVLGGGGAGSVRVKGKVTARGNKAGEKGGEIIVTGTLLTAEQTALLDASGWAGGGKILFGGDYLGGNATNEDVAWFRFAMEDEAIQSANEVILESGAQLRADATREGDGGKVVVWANLRTTSAAEISARGGSFSGNGGFIETSGGVLRVERSADASAVHGRAGTWLLDPVNILIGVGGIAVAALEQALSSSNVVVTTAGLGSGVGNVTIAETVAWGSDHKLTIEADNDIVLLDGAIISSAGGGNIHLRADRDANGVGTVDFRGSSSVYAAPGAIVEILYNPPGGYQLPLSFPRIGSSDVRAYMLVNRVEDLQRISSNLTGSYALGRDIDASATSTWNGGAGFVPIGRDYTEEERLIIIDCLTNGGNCTAVENNTFRGVLNGFSHSIEGLYIRSDAQTGVGLFGRGGTVMNLDVLNADIVGRGAVGIVFGISGTAMDVFTSGVVSGDTAGGIIGQDGGIYRSSSDATVLGSGTAGGLFGSGAFSTVSESFSTGEVEGYSAGGLIGSGFISDIVDSYSSAAINGLSSQGGLIGVSFSDIITSSYFSGTFADLTSANTGGLVGTTNGGRPTAMLNSYWNLDSTGVVRSLGEGLISGNAAGLPEVQLASALPAGFDPAIWGRSAAMNGGRPHLTWQVAAAPVGDFVIDASPGDQALSLDVQSAMNQALFPNIDMQAAFSGVNQLPGLSCQLGAAQCVAVQSSIQGVRPTESLQPMLVYPSDMRVTIPGADFPLFNQRDAQNATLYERSDWALANDEQEGSARVGWTCLSTVYAMLQHARGQEDYRVGPDTYSDVSGAARPSGVAASEAASGDAILRELALGNPVILNGSSASLTSYGHWVLAVGVTSDGKILAIDPYGPTSSGPGSTIELDATTLSGSSPATRNLRIGIMRTVDF